MRQALLHVLLGIDNKQELSLKCLIKNSWDGVFYACVTATLVQSSVVDN